MTTKHVAKRYITVVLTGVPGTGKTTLAKDIAPSLKAKIIAEKKLSTKKGIGKWNTQTREFDVNLSALRKEILSHIRKAKHNLIVDGHLLCELKLPATHVIVTHVSRSILEKRLSIRGYSDVKIQENLFCEEEDYCGGAVKKNYPRARTLNVLTHRPKKGVKRTVIRWIRTNTTK